MLKPGDAAPDFAVGETSLHRLLERRKGAVVFFFPRAFTPGWTREAGGFRREHERFRKADFEVIGVSKDSQETSERFRASLELPYAMVGDPEGKVLSDYGVRWPLLGLARRVTYVIGPDRRVREVIHGERDAEKHVKEACAFVAWPSSWRTPHRIVFIHNSSKAPSRRALAA